MSAAPVHVRSLDPDALPAGEWPGLESLLDGDERERADRYRIERDRRAHVAARALLRHTLAELGGREPAAWRFGVGPHGKPFLLDPPPGLDLRFNLTHTRGLVAVAVALGADIGIDGESFDRRRVDLRVAGRFFAPEEAAALSALATEEERRDRFLALWTLKEAFIKATGRGLGQPLADFAFSFAPLAIAFRPPLAEDPALWRFWQADSGRHRLAVALRWPFAGEPEVRHRVLTGLS